MVFITLDCKTINRIKFGKNIISVPAADIPIPATELATLLGKIPI